MNDLTTPTTLTQGSTVLGSTKLHFWRPADANGFAWSLCNLYSVPVPIQFDFDDEDACKKCKRGLAFCCWCGGLIRQDGDGWVDVETGDSCCENHVDGCGACDDGEPHPHEPMA